MRKPLRLIGLLALILMLAACGGGGTTTQESKWDSGTYDTSIWQ